MPSWLRYGPDALLLRLADSPGEEAFRRGRALADDLARHPPAGLLEYVPGFTTLLVRFDASATDDLEQIGRGLVARLGDLRATSSAETPVRNIPVVYDGEDLAALAAGHGLTPAEVVRLHSAPIYHVRLLGFAPGFPYLGDLDRRLHTPRRATPRSRVPAGSVAIGGEHTGIYPVESPGGWHIIGRTPVEVFARGRVGPDTDPRDVFLLLPGDRVRFVPVETGRT